MSDERLCWTPATELAALIRKKKVSPVEVLDAVLDRIERLNPKLNAFVTLTDEQARREAKAAERALSKKGARLGPLHGVPFSVKDLVITKGVRTTFGTPLYRDNVPSEDAPMVERLKAAGAIMLGKTNTPTFGWIGATHNLVFGITRNPWNLDRTTGGSSSGSASAVAARLIPLTLGADTGGSIRLPAALCGVVGLKPTRGRVSRYGLMGICPPFDCAGPLAGSAGDCALALAVIAGHDRKDPITARAAVDDYAGAIGQGLAGVRIGVVKELMDSAPLRSELRCLVADAVAEPEKGGARVDEVSIPLIDHASAIRENQPSGIANLSVDCIKVC